MSPYCTYSTSKAGGSPAGTVRLGGMDNSVLCIHDSDAIGSSDCGYKDEHENPLSWSVDHMHNSQEVRVVDGVPEHAAALNPDEYIETTVVSRRGSVVKVTDPIPSKMDGVALGLTYGPNLTTYDVTQQDATTFLTDAAVKPGSRVMVHHPAARHQGVERWHPHCGPQGWSKAQFRNAMVLTGQFFVTKSGGERHGRGSAWRCWTDTRYSGRTPPP